MGYKWSIHPSFMLLVIYYIITQQLHMYSLLLLSLAIHEVGHILTASLLKVRLRKLTLFPFGGQLLFMPSSIKKMLLVTMAGPLFTGGLLIISIYMEWHTLIFYQVVLLCFNSLPIWPLDGGKMLYYLLKLCFSIRYSVFIRYSLITASILLGVSIYVGAPILVIASIVVLVIEGVQYDRSRKYVQALEQYV